MVAYYTREGVFPLPFLDGFNHAKLLQTSVLSHGLSPCVRRQKMRTNNHRRKCCSLRVVGILTSAFGASNELRQSVINARPAFVHGTGFKGIHD